MFSMKFQKRKRVTGKIGIPPNYEGDILLGEALFNLGLLPCTINSTTNKLEFLKYFNNFEDEELSHLLRYLDMLATWSEITA